MEKELSEKEKELIKMRDDMGQLCFQAGRINFEIELKKQEIGDLSVKFHNLNRDALKLTKEMQKNIQSVPTAEGGTTT